MKDLNLVSKLKKLEESNVSSLKIEGRLKSPGWVSNISSIYRSALDGEVENEESKEALLKHSGREMGEGFASGLTNLTSEHSVRFGKLLGRVVDIVEDGNESFAVLNFSKKSSDTSLRFVTEDNEFLTIVHPAESEIKETPEGTGLIKNIGKIKKDALVFEVIPARNSKSGIGKMRYDVELEVEGSDLTITVYTDSDKYVKKQQFKKIVKAKRGVYPDAIYDKLVDKVVDGWRFNQLYSEEILLSKTQVNSIVKDVSYILAVTIRESNPLNNIELSEGVKKFISTLPQGDEPQAKDFFRYNFSDIGKITEKNIIVDEIDNNRESLDRLIKLRSGRNIAVSLFPVCFESDMENIKSIVGYLESKADFIYEINDIGHYNLLVNYLSIPKDRIVSGQGMACYNHLSVKFLSEEFGLKSVAVPMEMDSRGVIKLVEENNGYSQLRFTSLSTVPVMYSRAQSREFYEGAEFEDKIGTVLNVHQYRGMNIFYVNEFFSSEGCKDLEGVVFSEVIKEKKCIEDTNVTRKRFNLERRLY